MGISIAIVSIDVLYVWMDGWMNEMPGDAKQWFDVT